MKIVKLILGIIIFAISTSSWAFMPVTGLWNISAEVNGQPGRGMMIEVRNESLFLTYFGYRPDGSSVKYNASGPLINNSFTGDLVEYEGGPVIGGIYHPASLKGSIGYVTLSFTSGTRGTLTLPGDTPKAISKNALWATEDADGLLGTWLITSTIGTTPFISRVVLNTKLGQATANGNGAVMSSTGKYVCEFQVSGTLAGAVLCVNMNTPYLDAYAFKFSGDRGTGVNLYAPSGTTNEYESHALRIATKTGAETGLNNGTVATVQIMSATSSTMPKSITSDFVMEQTKEAFSANQNTSIHDSEKAAALMAWEAEVSTLLASKIK